MNDYKQALELSERLKQTYMDEEQQATLSIFCDQVWNEVNGDYDTACTQSNIINVLQHYVDTGGSIAGGYIHCVPNIIRFIETNYDFYKPIQLSRAEYVTKWTGHVCQAYDIFNDAGMDKIFNSFFTSSHGIGCSTFHSPLAILIAISQEHTATAT